MAQLLSLPNELLSEIFFVLPDKETSKNFAATCKTLSEIYVQNKARLQLTSLVRKLPPFAFVCITKRSTSPTRFLANATYWIEEIRNAESLRLATFELWKGVLLLGYFEGLNFAVRNCTCKDPAAFTAGYYAVSVLVLSYKHTELRDSIYTYLEDATREELQMCERYHEYMLCACPQFSENGRRIMNEHGIILNPKGVGPVIDPAWWYARDILDIYKRFYFIDHQWKPARKLRRFNARVSILQEQYPELAARKLLLDLSSWIPSA